MSLSPTLTTSPSALDSPAASAMRSALMPGLASQLNRLTATRPVLLNDPPAQHGAFWTCPRTGITIPKTLEANLRWRQRLLDEAQMSDTMQAQLRAACAVSCHFWLNAFGYTFRQKRVNDAGEEVPTTGHEAHYPFITWAVQDEFIVALCDAIDGGHDTLINKSRDMGASWLCLSVLHWYWQFRPSCTFLELSRKEELVDKKGSMDCLFEKHRYLLRWQPAWLRPRRIEDKYMHLGNLDLGSAIEGESTNGDAGRGGRKTAVLLDEFAAVPNGQEVDAATADTTACRIFNSTPKGAGTQFFDILTHKRARVLTLPWWRHPEKGRGAHQILDEANKPRWTSPWHAAESLRRDKRSMAQEVDMDHAKAGDTFFDHDEIARHERAFCRPPCLTFDVRPFLDLGDEQKRRLVAERNHKMLGLFEGPRGSWRSWLPLIDGRPPQDLTYVFGIDISNGSGGSNSVITCVADEIGQVVGKWWNSHVAPEELAEIAAFSAVWWGGNHGSAFIVHENNGPGGIFGRKLIVKLGYARAYFQRQDTKREQKTPRWGWHSNQQRKEILLGRYREAMSKDQLINPCKESLDEALDYVYDETGLLIPGRLKQETGGGRALHGDHVIADALTQLGRDELPHKKAEPARPPAGSFAARRLIHNRKLERQRDEWR
jgi:hypothetical protein